MKKTTATALKNTLGQVMEIVAREPITITKQGRNYAVLLAWEDYQRLVAAEEAWWGERAHQAEAEGEYLGTEASLAFLKEKLGES